LLSEKRRVVASFAVDTGLLRWAPNPRDLSPVGEIALVLGLTPRATHLCSELFMHRKSVVSAALFHEVGSLVAIADAEDLIGGAQVLLYG
jgi:hypothetical protein